MKNKYIYCMLVVVFMFCISLILNVVYSFEIKEGKAVQERYYEHICRSDRKIEQLNHQIKWGW